MQGHVWESWGTGEACKGIRVSYRAETPASSRGTGWSLGICAPTTTTNSLIEELKGSHHRVSGYLLIQKPWAFRAMDCILGHPP